MCPYYHFTSTLLLQAELRSLLDTGEGSSVLAEAPGVTVTRDALRKLDWQPQESTKKWLNDDVRPLNRVCE